MTETPTITAAELSDAKKALLARRLRSRRARSAIEPRPAGQEPPLSYAQERLWFLAQYAPDSTAYTIPFVLRVRGGLDADAVARALSEVAGRHEALRMRFPASEDGRPGVVVEPEGTFPLDLAEAAGEEAARDAVDEFLARPFDLAAGPPVRALLVRLPAGEHVLAFALHHIAADGWSTAVLLRELRTSLAGGTPEGPAVQYGDYAAWQRSREQSAADLDYWRDRLAGLEALDLPADRPRPAEQTYDGASHGFRIGAEVAGPLAALATEHGATSYMALLAVFGAVLGRHAGQEDFAVGSPVAGRTEPELEGLIGCFVNMLTMRADLSGDPSFVELLRRVRDGALDAYAHQELPFERLVAELNLPRDISRSPLFQVILAMQNYAGGGAGTGAGPEFEPFALGSWSTRFDLELYVSEDAGGLAGTFIYNTGLFDAATVERLAGRVVAMVGAVVASPDAPLSAADLMDDAERALMASWNSTAAPFPGGATLQSLVEEQVARTPDAPAVTFEGVPVTYAELNARANRVAHTLRGMGVGPGTLVTVCAERSVELVAALLGVIKSGAAYVPLDPEYPADRIAFMVEDSAAPVSLTQRALAGTAPPGALLLDDPGVWAAAPVTDPEPLAGPADPAYVIYTSGSTGRPKGVPNLHRGIVNRLHWMQGRYGLDGSDAVLQKTPASFDVSVWEFFWPLITGARLVMARPGGHKDAAYLCEVIAAEGVTTLHFVPSMLAVLLAAEETRAIRSVRRIICSGEELPVDLARRCLSVLPGELHNLYGPTEAAIDVSAWRCTPESLAGLGRVPIGGPVANTTLHVLDASMRPVPVGVPAELYIGGVQVAPGYLNRPELTASRFVTGPSGARLYRTGDLARWRADGTLDFLGRLDDQVKLRGLRIEPGEIEAALRAQPSITEAAVVVREDRPGDRRLVGYVVGAEPDRAALKRVLPDYMVPAAFVVLEELPLTPSGKLDRRALPAPTLTRDSATGFVAPSTPTEETVVAIWRDVLGVERIGIDDDFFDLGGHSLLATQVVARLRKAVGGGISVMDTFKYRTVRELAELIDTPADQRGPGGLLHELTPRRTAAPELSYVCVPYGGGSAVVYQPLADALPGTHALWSVAIPGADIGLDEARLPFDELAARCVAEILEKVDGPVALYGHCGVGSALIVEVARRLEAEGRALEAVYIGAIFPFARSRAKTMSALSKLARMEFLRSDQGYANWLTSMGVDMSDLDPGRARQIIQNMRKDSLAAEEYYTALFEAAVTRLAAPIITLAGERDPATDYYQERYREWHFLTENSAVVVLDEAGHFFLKYRAEELAEIVTLTHPAVAAGRTEPLAGRGPGWRLAGVSSAPAPVAPAGPQPSMRRFLAVASGQLVSIIGSALTEFAIPLWIYTTTHSLFRFALFAVIGLVPGMLVAPLAGAIVDRFDRRRVMLAGDVAAGMTQLLLGILLWTDNLEIWHIYPLLAILSTALMFQRLAYGSSIPQLVPKRYLGNANGVVQMATGTAQLVVPLVAVGLLAGIGLGGILVIDVASYAIAIGTLLLVRFPRTMPWRRKEPIMTEMLEGFRYSWGHRGFRSMLLYFACLNIFLSPLFVLISPLVLSFATLDDVARVSLAGGLGVFLGGLTMTVWGGPRHRRFFGVLTATLGLAACCLLTGLRPSLLTITAGVFGMTLWLTLLNGIYTTIVQVKVPQRYHGRVFALNTLIAWSTLPLGFGVVAPFGSKLMEPLVAEHGALAGSVGSVIGTGEGRGIGLMYVLFALVIAVIAGTALRTGTLSRFDDEVPDATPDDLIGRQVLAARSAAPGTPEAP